MKAGKWILIQAGAWLLCVGVSEAGAPAPFVMVRGNGPAGILPTIPPAVPAVTNRPNSATVPPAPGLRRVPTPLTSTNALPAPGLYKSEPYTCLILVPGPHPDDRKILKGEEPGIRMPSVQPDLRLVPRGLSR